MQVVVTGIGLRSSLGCLDSSWQNLLRGQCGIRNLQPFADLPSYPLALIGNIPVNLSELTQILVAEAVQDAQLQLPLKECGVVIGSSRAYQGELEKLNGALRFARQGCQRGWEKLGGTLGVANDTLLNSLQSQQKFLHALPAQLSAQVAGQVGTLGPVLAPMAACATGLWVMAQAYELIRIGQCQQVIAGAVESPVTPLSLIGFQRMGALAQTGAYPFDRQREGLVLGEGGAVFILESEETARQRGINPHGKVLGFGLTADACSRNRPDPNSRSALSAINTCLKRSELSTADIGYIHAHGTATRLNDAHEAQLIQTIFPSGVPVSSTKGATGHTLGASAALGIAFGLMALKHQVLPPCVGLRDLEFDLDVSQSARETALKSLLCLSFGFGGQNGAIVLGKSAP